MKSSSKHFSHLHRNAGADVEPWVDVNFLIISSLSICSLLQFKLIFMNVSGHLSFLPQYPSLLTQKEN